MTQDELKAQAALAAVQYVQPGQIIGVGTGSTVNHFIAALAAMPRKVAAAVSSSQTSTARLAAAGIAVLPAHEAPELAVYIDGADEIDPHGHMIKGGGGALTREKIVAAQAARFICIADESKQVQTLGRFALPVEIIPMAAAALTRRFAALGGQARLRMSGEQPYVTDNGLHILDVHGLQIADPLAFELETSQWPGIVTVGVFARQRAHICLLARPEGVQTLMFAPPAQ